MSDFFGRLAARALQAAPEVAPRLRSRFEPVSAAGPGWRAHAPAAAGVEGPPRGTDGVAHPTGSQSGLTGEQPLGSADWRRDPEPAAPGMAPSWSEAGGAPVEQAWHGGAPHPRAAGAPPAGAPERTAAGGAREWWSSPLAAPTGPLPALVDPERSAGAGAAGARRGQGGREPLDRATGAWQLDPDADAAQGLLQPARGQAGEPAAGGAPRLASGIVPSASRRLEDVAADGRPPGSARPRTESGAMPGPEDGSSPPPGRPDAARHARAATGTSGAVPGATGAATAEAELDPAAAPATAGRSGPLAFAAAAAAGRLSPLVSARGDARAPCAAGSAALPASGGPALPGRGTAVPAAAIQVTIGRVEVRATMAPAVARRTAPPAAAGQTLAEYLRQRAEGRAR